MSQHLNYIGGEWMAGKAVIHDVNPSDLSDEVGQYAAADAAQTAEAVAAAKLAFAKWSAATPQQRFDCLDAIGTEILARRDELGRLLSREEGKPLADGIGEAARAGYIFKFFAGEALRVEGPTVPSVRPGVDITVTPPASASEHSPERTAWTARCRATRDEEQAVSTVRAEPSRPRA